MLLILAEANAFNTSGAYNEFPKWGQQPIWRGWPEAAPIICSASIRASSSASIKSIGHPFVLKALVIHLFQKPSELKAALYLCLGF